MAVHVLTGSTGNIGRYLSGFNPLKTRLEDSIANMKAELQSIGEIQSFLHLAAMGLASDCEKNPEKARELNVEGARKWFTAAAQSGVRRFVFASTSHVYGQPKEQKPVSINAPTQPLNVYGRTKLEAENVLRELAREFPRTELVIVRFFSVLSPSMRPGYLLTGLHQRAQRRDFSPIPGLSYVRDFIEVEDVARTLTEIVNRPQIPPLINICSGRPTRVREIAEKVFAEYGLSIDQIEEAPGKPGDVTWIVGEPTPLN